ncbi:MAG: pyruvate formate lyase family protein [Planctomycetota bacterium]
MIRPATQHDVRTTYLDAYIERLHEPPVLREAHALAVYWKNCTIAVSPGELITGSIVPDEPVWFYYPRGTCVRWDFVKQLKDEGRWTAALEEKLRVVAQHSYGSFPRDKASEEERRVWDSGTAVTQQWAGHMFPDHERLLTQGWDGIAKVVSERAHKNPKAAGFYEAMRILVAALSSLWERFARKAEELNAPPVMSERFLRLAHEPARDFHDALQQIWLLHEIWGRDSYGRFDQYAYPYYAADVRAGRLARDCALALVLAVWEKTRQAGPIQNLTIGGLDRAGNDATNDLTYLALEATRSFPHPHPNLCVRLHKNSPEALWEAAAKTIACGRGIPALYNDEGVIAGLVKGGISIGDARDYALAGCGQVMPGPRAHFLNDTGLMNAAKVLEIALHNGYDPTTKRQVSPQTGAPGAFETYESLEEAVREHLSYFAHMEARLNNLDFRHFREHEGHSIRSMLTTDCLDRGRGIWDGGARYNGIQLEIAGLTNLADSLAAIRNIVFRQKRISLAALVEALDRNFEGDDELRMLLKSQPKFGNDNPEVDDIRTRLTAHLCSELRAQPAEGGGRFIPGEVVFRYHVHCGKQTGATPDGRKAGEPLADSCGASQGADRSGVTSLLNSASRIPQSNGPVTSTNLNVKFTRSTFDHPEAILKVVQLFKTYFSNGGQQLQVNVVSREELLEAQAHPERYQNLCVRVGGFSAYFCRLEKEFQDDIIARTAHQV